MTDGGDPVSRARTILSSFGDVAVEAGPDGTETMLRIPVVGCDSIRSLCELTQRIAVALRDGGVDFVRLKTGGREAVVSMRNC